VTPELREKLAGRKVVALVSGGKDSAATCLWLREQGIEHVRVFCDTGWEHPATYEYLRGPLTEKLGPIFEVRGPDRMLDLIRAKGSFPSKTRRYCTEKLKAEPMARLLAFLADLGIDAVTVAGIRAEESKKRAALPEWEWIKEYDCEMWRPILRWTLNDVIAIHNRHGLAPNPLYLMGLHRVGCWPCVNTTKADLRIFAKDEERVAFLAGLEAELTNRAGAPRGWYQAFTGWNPETGKRDGRPWSITKAVEWAQSWGQEELLDDPTPGCMRWGLCETTSEPATGSPSSEEPTP
jgi:3'-phosphoadenosine 5'-phosphosulfate sulfotransferase (PAPS reductase)/FAD synthetase